MSGWYEENGIIRFSVTSDGTTGEAWAARLEAKGLWLDGGAKLLLGSSHFQPTKGITTRIAVLKGLLFGDDERANRHVCEYAEKSRFVTPRLEVACLIRDKFSDEEMKSMGLSRIVVMHDPFRDHDQLFVRLMVDRVRTFFGYGAGHWLLAERGGYSRDEWPPETGFAFEDAISSQP